MSKKIAYLLAFCMVSVVIVIMAPSASAVQVASNIQTHHREGSSYPVDNYFRDEYDSGITDGWDDVYFSFRALDDGDPFTEWLYIYIYDPSSSAIPGFNPYSYQIQITDNGIYNSWDHGVYWDVPSGAEIGQYTLEIHNGTDLIGSHDFWVYDPTWTATVDLYEDSSYSVPSNSFQMNQWVYYTVHIEDQHFAPLYSNYGTAYSYAIKDTQELSLDTLQLDLNGDDYESFRLYPSNFDEGSWDVQIRYPYGTDIPTMEPFTIYEPTYTADIDTFTDDTYTTETSTFPANGQVFWNAYIKDQQGKNYPSYSWVYLQVEHDGQIYDNWNGYTDDTGNATDYFWLSNQGVWTTEEQVGLYTIRISDSPTGDPFSGSAQFEVIGIDITPDKDKYSQGEDITITVTSRIYQSDIDVTIYDYDDWGDKIKSWKDQSMSSKTWTTTYNLEDNLPDGQYRLCVNDSDTKRNLGQLSFNVKKYTLEIQYDAESYLPGEAMNIYYTITSNADGSGVSGTTIEYTLRYYDTEKSEWEYYYSDPISGDESGAGSFSVDIPDTASKTSQVTFHVWANDTKDHFYKITDYPSLGYLTASVSVDNPPPDWYLPGDHVEVNIYSEVDGRDPLKEADCALNVSKNGVEISDYTVSGLKTDMEGRLTYIFQLNSDAEIGEYEITVNVSKGDEWDIAMADFEIKEKRKMTLKFKFDNDIYLGTNYPQYYSGDTVTVTYTALRGEEVVDNANIKYWIRDSDDSYYLASGTSNTGEFTFEIPENYESRSGRLRFDAKVWDDSESAWMPVGTYDYFTAYIEVDRAGLILKPNRNNYSPGDTITVEYSVVGADIPEASYHYKITDDKGITVKKESLASSKGSFKFTVPTGNVPNSYKIWGYITDANGVNIAQSDVTITRLKGYMLTFTLDKNTYRPGETAKLKYKIHSLDGADIPEKFTLTWAFGGALPRSIQTSSSEGTLEIKVPDDAADGTGYFYIGSSSELGYAGSQQEAKIRANPNPLAETVGDVPIFSYILLILIIVSLLIGIAAWKHGKKALEESKLPPWKKDRPLPEPETYGEPGEGEEGLPPPEDEPTIPPEEGTTPTPEEGPAPPPEEGPTAPPGEDLPPPPP
ncbi:MAG: hypothetical protein JSW00_02215 [Thermoplasmata archaeon]|nr:MAG: hypothetical protein JSW00_02215 [Thermoplasmata archaeon]